MKKIYIGIGLGIVILVSAGFLFFHKSNTLLYTVKRETLVNTLQVTGTYAIASQIAVPSPTNGIITKLFVKNDDSVKKGDQLFYVESTASEAQKKAALASYLAAKATLDSDHALLFSLQSTMYTKWKTYLDLATNATYQNSDSSPNTTNRVLTEFTTAQDDWLAAEANYKNQQSVIAKDEASVASALQTYNETQNVTVTAPADGQVANLLAAVGDDVSVTAIPDGNGQVTGTAPPVLIIANYGTPAIVVSVSEENIPKVNVGNTATIVFDAFPDTQYAGHVVGVDSVGTNKEGIISYNVRLTIDHISPDIKPNMTANIVIETIRRDNVLTVPNTAIIEKEGNAYVQKAGHDAKHLTPVSVGIKGLIKSEIVRGISEGDSIVLPK